MGLRTHKTSGASVKHSAEQEVVMGTAHAELGERLDATAYSAGRTVGMKFGMTTAQDTPSHLPGPMATAA
jgi:hypothetical protein